MRLYTYRSGHACSVMGTSMYVFGGFNGGDEYVPATYYNDLHVLHCKGLPSRLVDVCLLS